MPDPGEPLNIAIAGAGIAGLTASLCLAKHGFPSTVFEHADSFHEIGAGIQLSPNAMQVLSRIGLDGQVGAQAIEPEAVDIRDGPSGTILTSIPLRRECRQRYGAPYLVVHRADLMQVLLNAAHSEPLIRIRTGSAVSGVYPASDRIAFNVNGEEIQADILLAADGVHSKIRKALTGQAAENLGKTAWRATLSDPAYDDVVTASRTGLWLGRGAHLVHYPLRAGRELNLVLIGDAEAQSPHFLLDHFDTRIRRLASAARWIPWPLLQVGPAAGWVNDRVVLLGDAAHAMLPTAAQGGAQAIEDAFVLAQCLARRLPERAGDPAPALAGWEQARKPRVERIVSQANRNLDIYTMGGVAAAGRNLAIRLIPGKQHLARFDWLYGWRPRT
jgi:salicylate hydroxylase